MNLRSLFDFLRRYTFLKTNRFYIFSRGVLFPFGVKLISKFVSNKINENLIVMGAYGGETYLDNTKYLFKYLNQHSDYKLVWITKSYDVIRELNKKGYKAVFKYDLKAIKLLRSANYIFMSHGLVDVLPIKFSPKTTVILTWHGTPLKNIDVRIKRDNRAGYLFHLNLKYNNYTDFLLTATKFIEDQKLFCTALQISQNKLLDFGYPKNDILYNNEKDFVNNLRKQYEISEEIYQIILYAPTWRAETMLEFPISKETLIELNNFLEESNSIFLLKAHMYVTKINFKDYKNIRLVEKTADVQELAVISDLLITDYSSIYFDYLLTMKPIVFFAYDLKEYEKKRGFYYTYEDVAPGPIVFNGEDLLKVLRNIERIDKEYLDMRKKTRDRFNKYQDGNSTERLLKFLNIEFS